jgi:hypothetical protein
VEAAVKLRAALAREAGAVVAYRIAEEGLRVQSYGE